MITLTPVDAQDLMNKQFLNAISVPAVATLLGYPLPILWAGIELSNKPDVSKFFCRISHKTVLEGQSSLSNCEGIQGQARFTTYGLTFVQIFGPTKQKDVARTALLLATICRNAFRRAIVHPLGDDAVWFRNARIQSLDPENDLYRLNVVADHQYDELG